MDQIYDYLIALNVVACPLEKAPERQGSTSTMTVEEPPRIIQISWGTYDVRKKMVLDECEYFVKPYKFTELSAETISKTGITNEDMLAKGIPLSDAMHRLNEALYLNYICKNASFCIVTSNDDLLTTILPKDAKEAGIRLANHFFSYFEITLEFKKLYKVNTNFTSLNEYLAFLKLKETQGNNIGQIELKSILRLTHRLVSDGHKFENPNVLNSQHQLITERTDNPQVSKKHQNKKWSTFIRSKSPESFRNPSKKWFIRIRGFPVRTQEADVTKFLRGIRVYKEDINFYYDFEGKFTGEVFVQLHNESDFKEALSFNLSELGSRSLEVSETNENEFNRAKVSQYPEKREMNVERSFNWSHLLREDLGILKMRGLPYSCTEEDIRSFFRGFNILDDGIKRAIVGGKPSGECFLVFESKEQAFAAMGLNMEKIGSRFIELFSSNVRELENFLYHVLSNNISSLSKENMPTIPLEKRKATLMMNGLPFQVSKMDIYKFFSDFRLRDNEVYLIPSHSGKFSGNALITFDDELQAQKALKTKNLSYINNRYVELTEYK